MKIKTKLTLGVGLLFILIILLSLVGGIYLNLLKQETKNILTANYNSLRYSRNMLAALEDHSGKGLTTFEANLKQQEANITEIGEADFTITIREAWETWKKSHDDDSDKGAIRKCIFQIMDLNMHAIQRKSEVAENTAGRAVIWIVITGALCFIIAFLLLIKLPANIANPIRELTESIREIARNNYSERVNFESHGEFGELAQSFNTMAMKLEEYNNSNVAKLLKEKQRIETLINNMQDPVIGLDEDLKIIFVNEEALRIIGMSGKDLIGRAVQELAIRNDLIRTLIQDLYLPKDNSGLKSKPIKIFANNKEGYFEKEMLGITITPTGEEVGKPAGQVIVLRNVTEYKELDFAKTNFIATVSHEFKTPISSIKMSLQLLSNEQIGTLNPEQNKLVESIREDANRLLKITGELLNVTQVESGKLQLSLQPSDPQKIVQEAIDATRQQADQKQVTLRLNCPKTVPDIQADSEKTTWVLTNLISNAIRYSYDNATVVLSIEQHKNTVQFSVQDSGQGIDPQFKDKIFDRYFRIPGSHNEGTGLGLAISKEFIVAQGGSIEVESELGVGSTFTITLPIIL